MTTPDPEETLRAAQALVRQREAEYDAARGTTDSNYAALLLISAQTDLKRAQARVDLARAEADHDGITHS
jgi:hypothetical protein